MGHSDVEMFALRAFAVDVSAERGAVKVRHICGAVQRTTKIARAVLDHRGIVGNIFAGLVSGRFAICEGKQLVGIGKERNVAYLGKDSGSQKVAYAGNGRDRRIEFEHDLGNLTFQVGHLGGKETDNSS